LKTVQEVYSGPEGQLWELVMGEQIHIGGLTSSADLAGKAGIAEGSSGVDLCCCTGAGMRYLVRFHGVASMTGVDATPRMVEAGQQRCEEEGLADRIEFLMGDACACNLPGGAADFVWGEDAWCYVEDKSLLIAEAARLVKPGGVIAFTDWVESAEALAEAEAARFMQFMKFPSFESLDGYRLLLKENGCAVEHAEHTGRFAPHVDLYIDMLTKQLTYDAFKIIGFNRELMASLQEEMLFMRDLAHQGKIAQGLFVARKA
jgi:ubiquinone/menaquinone biosynthesis C-methylase UbiE